MEYMPSNGAKRNELGLWLANISVVDLRFVVLQQIYAVVHPKVTKTHKHKIYHFASSLQMSTVICFFIQNLVFYIV
jgi:hypothetical protein